MSTVETEIAVLGTKIENLTEKIETSIDSNNGWHNKHEVYHDKIEAQNIAEHLRMFTKLDDMASIVQDLVTNQGNHIKKIDDLTNGIQALEKKSIKLIFKISGIVLGLLTVYAILNQTGTL